MNDEEKKEFLKKELVVALNIYEVTKVKGELIWFSKIRDMVKEEITRSEVSRIIDHMFDCGILKGEWVFDDGDGWIRSLTLGRPYDDYYRGVYEAIQRDKND